MWSSSAYLAVFSLGTTNLFVSYFWLPETKGIDLDAVQIGTGGDDEDEEKIQEKCQK